jgi:XTP/dITP diphosphohydrolase
MKILVATNNQHKISEIQNTANKLLKHNIIFLSPQSLNINLAPEENGSTLKENAKIKAVAFYDVARLPVLADDSGLEIDALNGLPGVNSARFAEAHNDKANREKVLKLLENESNRNAKFCSVLAFYDGTEIKYYVGTCCGKIINEERGTNGFGYDSIFIPDGYDKTFAEMNDVEKNSISHRYLAVLKFCEKYNTIRHCEP